MNGNAMTFQNSEQAGQAALLQPTKVKKYIYIGGSRHERRKINTVG